MPLSAGALSIIGYRLSRTAYLLLGNWWQVIHTLLAPLRLLVRPFGAGLEIHYQATIGPGLKILHPSLGVVISGDAVIGRDLVLTGGNCIGGQSSSRLDIPRLGNGVTLGANAVVLGPGLVGDGVIVGAGSIVIGDAPAGSTVVGSPARPL